MGGVGTGAGTWRRAVTVALMAAVSLAALGKDAGQGIQIEWLAQDEPVRKAQGMVLRVKGIAHDAGAWIRAQLLEGRFNARTITADQDDPGFIQRRHRAHCMFPVAFHGKADQPDIHAACVERGEGGQVRAGRVVWRLMTDSRWAVSW